MICRTGSCSVLRGSFNAVMTTCLAFLASVACVPSSAQEPASNDEPSVPRMLFLTQSKGYVHSAVKREPALNDEVVLSPAELAMRQLANDTGEFTVVFSQDAAADFTRENLQNFDIVAFYTSGDLPIEPSVFEYFKEEWVTQPGHGVLGFHAASDTFRNYEPYWDLMGGTFHSHPWRASSTVTMQVHDLEHPAMKPFAAEKFEYQDEIYQYVHWQPEKVRVLMSLDMEDTELKRPYHVPVSWCKQIGEGRLFYNNMGHRDETWQYEPFLESIVAAVRWIGGKEEGSAEPNPEVSEAQHAASIKFANAAGVTMEKLEAEQKAKEAVEAAKRAAEEAKKQKIGK